MHETYHHDNLYNAKGKLIKVSNGAGLDHSTTEYTEFDSMGRVRNWQKLGSGLRKLRI